MELRSSQFDLQELAASIRGYGFSELQDALLQEIWIIKQWCKNLGFGYMPKKGSKARLYFDDLHVLVRLTMGERSEFREGFVDEACEILTLLGRSGVIVLSDFS